MTPEEFRAPFHELNREQSRAALDYLLGVISYLATAKETPLTKSRLKECAKEAVEYGKTNYPEVKPA